MRAQALALAVAIGGGSVAACTVPPDSGAPSSPPGSIGPVTPPGSTPPTPSTPEAAAVPLALAVHPNRPAADVDVAAARQLVGGGARSWTAMGQPRGPVRIVTGGVEAGIGGPAARQLRNAAAALDVVRADRGALALVPAGTVDPTVRVLTVGGVHPLREPAAYPLEVTPAVSAAPSPPPSSPSAELTSSPDVVTITIVGDVMLGRRVGDAMAAAGDLAAPLRPFAERLAGADVTVGNFEATLSENGSPTQGGDSFTADPGVAAGLQLAGFDVLSLANNHVGDWGETALVETVAAVRSMGIQPVGAGADLAEARAPAIVEVGGTRIGVLATDSIGESPAATTAGPGTNRLNMPPRTGPLDEAALARIGADITALSGQVDTVVVIPHWGTQYTNVPEPSQRLAAEAFVAAGADLVVGGHPHWVQGWEMIGDALVVHSLGNFVFDMDFMRETQEGIVVEVVLWDGRVVAVEPVPYVIGEDFAPRPASAERAATIFDLFRETSAPPFGDG